MSPVRAGKRIGIRMRLRPGQQAEYRRRHDALWPELRALLSDHGISDYTIFHDPGTDSLFALLHAEDPARLEGLADAPVMRRWWDHMADIMDTEPDNRPRQVPLVEVFHMD